MLIISIAPISNAQNCTYTLSGKVVDYHDGSVLVGAIISVVGQEKSAISTIEGKYELTGICKGANELEVSHPECATIFIPIEITSDTIFNIKLEHHLEELEEVKVVSDAIFDKTNSAQEVKLKSQTLEKYSAATLGDALKELGGVSTLNTGATIVKPAIHGLIGSRVLIINDGVRMQDMEWGDEHAPTIDINSAGSISVIKGASALQYGGDAIGGTIVLEQLKFPAKDTLFGKTLLTAMSNGRGGTLATELTKVHDDGFFIRGQSSFKRLGDQEAPDYELSNTGIQELGASVQFGKRKLEWGFGGKYSYYDAEIAILRASHIGSVDDLIRSINSGEPLIIRNFTYNLLNPRQKVRHHIAKIDGYKRFEGVGKWSVQYDFQNNKRLEFDIRRGDRDNRASLDLELTTHTLSTDFKWDSDENFKLQIGALGRYQDNFANPDTGVRRLIPDYEKYELGTFAIGEYIVNNSWTIDAGLRYDYSKIDALKFYQTSRWEERGYDVDFAELVLENRGTQLLTNPIFDYSNVSATLGFNYTTLNQNIKFNYALAQRAPNPAELFSDGLHHSAARIELGDIRIKSETSHKLMLTYQRNFNRWGFSLEPYANFINDFILLEPTGVELNIRGAFPVWNYRQTDARLLGVDASVFSDWSNHWRSEHQFSIVKGNDIENNIALINIPSANISNKLVYSKPECKDLQISLQSQYVFHQNEFPQNIQVFSPEQQEDVLLEINTAPEAYHLLNFDTQLVFDLDKQKLTTSLSINNILNTNYREYLNRQRFFADDLGRNIMLQVKLNY